MPARTRSQRRREARDRRRAARRPHPAHIAWRDLPNALRDWSTLSRSQRSAAAAKGLIVVSAMLVVVVGSLLGIGLYDEFVAAPNRPVVTVNETAITAQTYTQYLAFRQFELQRERQRQTATAGTAEGNDLGAQLAGLTFEAVTELADAALVRREAEQRRLTVTPADIEAELQAFLTPPDNSDEPDSSDSLLERIGLDRATVEGFLADRVLARRLTDALLEELGASPPQIRVAHIRTSTEEGIQSALERLDAGESFEDVASTLSTDADSRERGGDLGWVPRGIAPTAWDETAFALEPGELSEPVAAGGAWYLIKVAERADDRPLEPEAAVRLRQARFDAWLQDAAAASRISYSIDAEIIEWSRRHAPG